VAEAGALLQIAQKKSVPRLLQQQQRWLERVGSSRLLGPSVSGLLLLLKRRISRGLRRMGRVAAARRKKRAGRSFAAARGRGMRRKRKRAKANGGMTRTGRRGWGTTMPTLMMSSKVVSSSRVLSSNRAGSSSKVGRSSRAGREREQRGRQALVSSRLAGPGAAQQQQQQQQD
jgi:hypothetical protein